MSYFESENRKINLQNYSKEAALAVLRKYFGYNASPKTERGGVCCVVEAGCAYSYVSCAGKSMGL
ncbi:hypothetical protein [Adlercreutzia sp. ZJ154]|uniref:hypothetical protein n=1 Tax=Adlercreutzia sp. ZJ154 TaxID=2709790 RepID=UPI0013EE3517|nr:hypothetical protein [Adlercreutzia sp. ZJ154]